MAVEIKASQLLIQIRDEGVAATVSAYRKNLLSSRTLIELFENTPDRDVRLFLASYPTVPSALIEWMLETEEDCEIFARCHKSAYCSAVADPNDRKCDDSC